LGTLRKAPIIEPCGNQACDGLLFTLIATEPRRQVMYATPFDLAKNTYALMRHLRLAKRLQFHILMMQLALGSAAFPNADLHFYS